MAFSPQPFQPPKWATALTCPGTRVGLCHLPTPVEPLELPIANCTILLKRDDMTGGAELTGNKTRKLEFLLADALAKGCDVVVTTGGQQSNHCRATAAACARIGLACRMTLRDDGHGDNGNFFLGGLMGAKQRVVPKADWAANGGHAGHLEQAATEARDEGRTPAAVPCGGSTPVGVWGYIMCCEELLQQGAFDGVSDIVCSSGSGGTVAGLVIGTTLLRAAGLLDHPVHVTSYCVCDTPDDFAATVAELYTAIASAGKDSLPSTDAVLANLTMKDAVGGGYGITTAEDRAFIRSVGARGVLFDRTYTAKALHALARDLADGTMKPTGRVLFVHTGGAPSVFDRHETVHE